jgi:acyl-CoA thioester hydrolase
MPHPFLHQITVTPDVLDANGHANNVAYVQWLQDAAIHHARDTGCTQITSALGATWVVRSHFIEYLAPAFSGDSITIHTWVSNIRKVRSLRKYQLVRSRDNLLIARAETDWVFVDAKTGRPRPIPAEIKNVFPVLLDPEHGTDAKGGRPGERGNER